MALKLAFDSMSQVLNEGGLPSRHFYVRAYSMLPNTLTNTGYIPLLYKVLDENNQPVGDWLQGLQLPAQVPIMRPKELMMTEGSTPYRLTYDVVRNWMRLFFEGQATVEDLL